MNTARRNEILTSYAGHVRRFDAAAQRRSRNGGAEIIASPSALPSSRDQDLTSREIEVLRLVADGQVDCEIGHGLLLSVDTVGTHVRHILAKLGVRSRAHAVAMGFRRGLIT